MCREGGAVRRGFQGGWGGQREDKNELVWSGAQEGTRAAEERGRVWEVKDNRGGLETYNDVPPLAKRQQLAPNNGYISVFLRGADDKVSSSTLAYQKQD